MKEALDDGGPLLEHLEAEYYSCACPHDDDMPGITSSSAANQVWVKICEALLAASGHEVFAGAKGFKIVVSVEVAPQVESETAHG